MYIVKYTGPFGFIKPWTAVRDEETFSQQFLTPSIVAGIERKLFPELLRKQYGIYKIKRHRLSYSQISSQQEQTQPRGWNEKGRGIKKEYSRPYAILTRGVLLNPVLFLAFEDQADAKIAQTQHICLARNEDMLYAVDDILEVTEDEFDTNEEMFRGFELIFGESKEAFMVGYNRLNNNQPMFGTLKVFGNPVRNNY
ncbi:MAG: hypothetical protein L3J74_04970 [Bacteroidales bacterium]|nr:hypothetical protein [Bacteroidales bacterium]